MMAEPYPDNPFVQGGLAPWGMEGDVNDAIVEGEIPAELSGSYYRNGPNPQFAPLPSYHIFDGDGMLHAFHLEEGRCRYRNRWIRTERFCAERAAGERIFGGLMAQSDPDPRAVGISGNTANTAVVWHAGKLLALWEGGAPYEIDPISLETIGPCDFAGKLLRGEESVFAGAPRPFTAHPKLDPKTGEMLFFGYSITQPCLGYGAVGASGEIDRLIDIEAPHPSMLHDFLVSNERVVLPVFPNVFRIENLAKGESPITWEPEHGTQLGVLPRGGSAEDVSWIATDPCNVFHFLNAHDEGSTVVAHVCRFDAIPLFGADPGVPQLFRWEIDTAAGSVKQAQLDDLICDFPRIDDRFAGSKVRHGWCAASVGEAVDLLGVPGFNGVVHYDLETGARREHVFAAQDICGEPLFVPRSEDAAEGDGFILVLVQRGNEHRSDLVILDAQNVEAAPIGVVQLPHRIPLGFHGAWRPNA